eukprot:3615691-Rhodomonas_salina.1
MVNMGATGGNVALYAKALTSVLEVAASAVAEGEELMHKNFGPDVCPPFLPTPASAPCPLPSSTQMPRCLLLRLPHLHIHTPNPTIPSLLHSGTFPAATTWSGALFRVECCC